MLTNFSTQLADLIDAAAPSVVQVRAGGRAASGLIYGPDLVLTTGRVVGRDEHPEVKTADGHIVATEIAGWDAASRLVLLKAPGVGPGTLSPGGESRVGHLAVAIGRSWSNGVTAVVSTVAIIGGPLRTGPRRQLERVIRIAAPLHDGFAGGAVLGADGALIGIATAAAIRGLPIVIPANLAWQAAATMAQHGRVKRGYLGIAAQPVGVPQRQRPTDGAAQALLVVGVKDPSPAAEAGLFVGDLLLALDEVALTSPEDLLDLLVGERVGRPVTLRVLRGGAVVDVAVSATERP